MTQKFGRQYRITIDPKDGLPPIVVQLPFTVRFWIKRDIMASLNNLSIDIYNLSLANRRRIYQDRWDLQQNVVNGVAQGRRSIKFEIGYDQLYEIYSGDIFSASSAREGTNIITRIEGFTGIFDIASSQTNITIGSGQTQESVFKALIGQFPTLQLGAVGNWPSVFNRPVVLSGNTWNLIKQYSGGKCFIDNGKVYIMQDNEALLFTIPTFDASTGLLETPRREQASLTITTLLEASIKINQLVNISSVVEPVYNGQYKVTGLQHSGVISGAVSGDCRSVFFLNAPSFFSYNQVQGQ